MVINVATGTMTRADLRASDEAGELLRSLEDTLVACRDERRSGLVRWWRLAPSS
jgi:hypothetical protein